MEKQEFEEFKKRLNFHNIDREGVDRHITANPIFNVQTKKRTYGIDDGYTDLFIWQYKSDYENTFDDMDEVINTALECDVLTEKIKKYCDQEELDLDSLTGWEQQTIVEDLLGYEKIGYVEEWNYVNSHLTREGAEAFIRRKQHDYGEMRVFVNSQYFCWEFNDLIKDILDGKIGYIDQSPPKQERMKMKKSKITRVISYLLLTIGIIILIAARVHGWDKTEGENIYYYWHWYMGSAISIGLGVVFALISDDYKYHE